MAPTLTAAAEGGATMSRAQVPDEVWEVVRPLLPRHKARPGKQGRPPVSDGACLSGIVFVLHSGIPWRMLPEEMGCGSGVTCCCRLTYWQRKGVWKKLLEELLQRVGQEKGIDWPKAVLDSQSICAVFRGRLPAKTPPIGLKKGANATSSSMVEGFRWPCASAGHSGTTRRKR